MYTENLITDDEFEVISSAPNDMKMNCVVLQFVKLMKACSLLQKVEPQKYAGVVLNNGKQRDNVRVYILYSVIFNS